MFGEPTVFGDSLPVENGVYNGGEKTNSQWSELERIASGSSTHREIASHVRSVSVSTATKIRKNSTRNNVT